MFKHPKTALKNAQDNFTLNALEKDIIRKHMWPLTPRFPKYKETFIVNIIDKIIATKEFIIDIVK